MLDNETLKRLADIVGDQADRLNSVHMHDEQYVKLYADTEFLLHLKNPAGVSLLKIVGDWYEDQE